MLDRRFGDPRRQPGCRPAVQQARAEHGEWLRILRGHPTEKKQVHHTDKVRRSAWRIVCAGGYFAAGFTAPSATATCGIASTAEPLVFTVKDEGAAAQLGTLHDFFTALPFWRMQPFGGVTGDAVALADPGKIYVIYLPHGGAATVDQRKRLQPTRAQPGACRSRPRSRTRAPLLSPPARVRQALAREERPDRRPPAAPLQHDRLSLAR